jgi:hypothetical protein
MVGARESRSQQVCEGDHLLIHPDAHQRVKGWHQEAISLQMLRTSLVLAVPPVQSGQNSSKSLCGVWFRKRGRQVGEGMLGHPVSTARIKEIGFLGKVVVDGQPLNTRTARDLGDGRPCRAKLVVKGGRRLDDPKSGCLLLITAGFEPIPTFFD